MFRGKINWRNDGWVYLEVNKELGRYLRYMYYLYTYKTVKLSSPSRNEHITIVTE